MIHETTEHKRALRAEGAAFALLGSGLLLAVLGTVYDRLTGAAVGLVLTALGAALLASVVSALSEPISKEPHP